MQVMDSDRILNLLGNMPSNSIDMVLMTLWWSWHVCDEVVHGKSPPTLEAFMCFLDAYMESLIVIKYHLGEHIRENLLQDTIILWHLPKHTAQLWFFSKYHYNVVSCLPKHTIFPKIESLTFFLWWPSYDRFWKAFPFWVIWFVLAKAQFGNVFWQC
jgi:hypothetical protein